MNRYSMTLIAEGKEIKIPVLPEKLKITSPGKNDTSSVLLLGDVLLLRKKGLRTVAWESFFPVNNAPFVSGSITSPVEIVRAVQTVRDSLKPLRFLITGTDLDINIRMGVDSFDYEERAGELGDIYYSIKLSEWKDYSPRRIVLPATPSKPTVSEQTTSPANTASTVNVANTAQVKEPTRTGEPPEKPKTYTVRPGESLVAIAKKIYGKGEDYTKIYNANKWKIGPDPSRVYPGTVLTIP